MIDIVDDRNNTTRLDDILIGGHFMYDGELFQTVQEAQTGGEPVLTDNVVVPCVNLETGEMFNFCGNEYVERVVKIRILIKE